MTLPCDIVVEPVTSGQLDLDSSNYPEPGAWRGGTNQKVTTSPLHRNGYTFGSPGNKSAHQIWGRVGVQANGLGGNATYAMVHLLRRSFDFSDGASLFVSQVGTAVFDSSFTLISVQNFAVPLTLDAWYDCYYHMRVVGNDYVLDYEIKNAAGESLLYELGLVIGAGQYPRTPEYTRYGQMVFQNGSGKASMDAGRVWITEEAV